MTRTIRAFGHPTKRTSASGAHCGASRYELASNPTVSHTGRRKSRRSISIRPRVGNAPIQIFIHGGAWRGGSAKDSAYPAEMFVSAGAIFIAR